MLKLNTKLENLGEELRGAIKYDFKFDLDSFDFLLTKFKKDTLVIKNINKNLYKKLK
jgi:hypothetical protein